MEKSSSLTGGTQRPLFPSFSQVIGDSGILILLFSIAISASSYFDPCLAFFVVEYFFHFFLLLRLVVVVVGGQ